MATVTLNHYGITGSGPTVTEAKRDAGAQITQLVRDLEAGPHIEVAAGHTIVATRDAHGWGYSIVWPDGHIGRSGSGRADREETIRSARMHVADAAWTHEIGATMGDEAFLAQFKLSPADKRDLMGRWQWQRAYRRAVDNGASDETARDVASGRLHAA